MASKTSKKRPKKRKPPSGSAPTKDLVDAQPDEVMEDASPAMPLRPSTRRPKLLALLIGLFSVWVLVLIYLAYRVNF